MGKVLMSGIVPQLEAPCPPHDPVFANNDWETIIKVCQANKVPDTWAVGDQKTMTINGIEYHIDIIGKNHDTYADGSGKAPLTLQTHTTSVSALMASNGWKESAARNTELPSVLLQMPIEVQSGIKEVKKITSAGGLSSTLEETVDKLFFLSEIEILGTTTHSFAGEGTQYAYYAAGNTPIKNYSPSDASPYMYWTRSPDNSNSGFYCLINDDGSATMSPASAGARGAFAFCF